MRKITEKAVNAFESNIDFKSSNTKVCRGDYYLHDNKIAEFTSLFPNDKNKSINITLAGWNTNTTRERLNGLKGVRVTTKQGQAYLNGEKWDGEWVTVIRQILKQLYGLKKFEPYKLLKNNSLQAL